MHVALLGAVGDQGAAAAAMEFIAKVGPMDGTTTSVSFTSVPQTYRALRIVMANGRRDSSANAGISVQYNSDSTALNYGWQCIYQLGPGGGPSMGAANHYWPPVGDFPMTTDSTSCVWDIGNYSDASVGTTCQWQLGSDTSNSGAQLVGGLGYEIASAVTQIDLVSDSTTSGYYLEAPTTFALFGIGEAP